MIGHRVRVEAVRFTVCCIILPRIFACKGCRIGGNTQPVRGSSRNTCNVMGTDVGMV